MKYCPFCSIGGSSKIEMIRPRADMLTFGTKKMGLLDSDVKVDVLSNEVPINEKPLLTIIDNKQTQMKYFDYMCPQCNVVLFYGEKEYMK